MEGLGSPWWWHRMGSRPVHAQARWLDMTMPLRLAPPAHRQMQTPLRLRQSLPRTSRVVTSAGLLRRISSWYQRLGLSQWVSTPARTQMSEPTSSQSRMIGEGVWSKNTQRKLPNETQGGYGTLLARLLAAWS